MKVPPTAVSPATPFEYEWQRPYLQALMEAEHNLPSAIEAAIKTITDRERVLLSSSAADPKEAEAIADALANLRALKKGIH